MAEGEIRIPAWRRLGLALKKETQSGITAPEPSASHGHVQHVAPYDERNGSREEVHSSSEPALNGKSSNLGKRKHQHDTAEEIEPQKRSKASTQENSQRGTTEDEQPVVPQVESAPEHPSQSTQSPLDAGQTKGDPNYRKKKSKPSKSRRRDNEGNANHTEVVRPRSVLSPDIVAPAQARQTLLASTEKEEDLAPAVTPQQPSATRKANSKDSSGSPSAVDRRKSVAFTPDTKSVDGSSAQDYFKKWTAEQKGADVDYFASDVAEFYRNAINEGELRDAKKDEDRRKEKEKDRKAEENKSKSKPHAALLPVPKAVPAASTAPVTSRSKKKDPSYYVSYLQQYYTDREHWKFNKAKQNDVIDNALNIFRVTDEHSEALLEYVAGLKGAGVIERLRNKCDTTLKELEKEEDTAKESGMDSADARKAMHDEALQERITKEQKRRKVEGDVEGLLDHPHSDGYIRRMRRKRAEALLLALGRTAPILPAVHTNGINPLVSNIAPARDSKKRKRRVEVSSSESSSDSSSSEESSSSSESESDDDSERSDSDDSDSDSASEASAPLRNEGKSSGANSTTDSNSVSDQSESDDSDSDSD